MFVQTNNLRMDNSNPVVEEYNGIKIRKSNKYMLRIGAPLFKFLILESERTGLPISKILAFSSKPCERCSQIEVIAYNSKDEEVRIKRGILSRHIQGSGSSIIKQAHAKRC